MIKATKILALSLLAISGLANPHSDLIQELRPLWSSWKAFHNKEYTVAEETARFAIFVENYKKIVSFNAESNGVKLTLNRFGDITAEEFKSIYTGGYKKSLETEGFLSDTRADIGFEMPETPNYIDWRTKNVLNPLKDQGMCNSCWAFSATAAIEAAYAILNGTLYDLSEQQLVDCDTKADGCNGGDYQQAMKYAANNGLETETDYPYIVLESKCQYDKTKSLVLNNGAKALPKKSAASFKTGLLVRPISVGIEANQDIFQFYSSGVINGTQCGDNIDHSVLAVGYISVDGMDAFVVRNQYGQYWGQQGYAYISTDDTVNNGNGVCGILADPVVPTIKQNW